MEQGAVQMCLGTQNQDDMSAARRSAFEFAAGKHTFSKEVGTNRGRHDEDSQEIKRARDTRASDKNLTFYQDVTSAASSGFTDIDAVFGGEGGGEGTQGLLDISDVSSDDGNNSNEHVVEGVTDTKHEHVNIEGVNCTSTMTSTLTVWDFKSTLEDDIRKLQSGCSFQSITPTGWGDESDEESSFHSVTPTGWGEEKDLQTKDADLMFDFSRDRISCKIFQFRG